MSRTHPNLRPPMAPEQSFYKLNPAPQLAQTGDEGWYYFDGLNTFGPTSTQSLRALGSSAAQSNTLVSRCGFNRWYTLAAVLDWLQEGAEPDPEFRSLRLGPSPEKAAATEIERVPNKVQARQHGPKIIAATNQGFESLLAQQTMAAAQPTKSKAAAHHHEEFCREQRLGQARSALFAGLFLLPLSLGLYWLHWTRLASREILWHAHSSTAHRAGLLPPLYWAFIPGAHVYFVYHLAAQIALAEGQNGYRRCNARLAAGLSLCPPLALIYLQEALNQHWALHILHRQDHAN